MKIPSIILSTAGFSRSIKVIGPVRPVYVPSLGLLLSSTGSFKTQFSEAIDSYLLPKELLLALIVHGILSR